MLLNVVEILTLRSTDPLWLEFDGWFLSQILDVEVHNEDFLGLNPGKPPFSKVQPSPCKSSKGTHAFSLLWELLRMSGSFEKIILVTGFHMDTWTESWIFTDCQLRVVTCSFLEAVKKCIWGASQGLIWKWHKWLAGASNSTWPLMLWLWDSTATTRSSSAICKGYLYHVRSSPLL